jgi:hypothetical protein
VILPQPEAFGIQDDQNAEISIFSKMRANLLRIFLYNCKNAVLVILCLVRLYLICGSGKVIQISEMLLFAKKSKICSILVLCDYKYKKSEYITNIKEFYLNFKKK